MVTIDTSTEFGARVAKRLGREAVIWLTTVGASTGTPQPNPVWFGWDGAQFIVFSQPDTPKLGNVARNPRVALHFNDAYGEDVVIFAGQASQDGNGPTQEEWAAFVEKYRDGMERIGLTPDGFACAFSITLRIVPDRLRGF